MKQIFTRLWRFFYPPKSLQLLIMRFVQDQFLIGVTGIIFNDKEEVLLFKNSYRTNTQQTLWSLPGGYLKSKEHPAEGLEREIIEESGLTVSADEQLKTRTDRSSARLDLCYVGKFIGGQFSPSTEVTECGFFSFENLPLIATNQLYLIEKAINQRKTSEIKIVEVSVKAERPTSFVSRLRFLIASK